VKTVLIVDDESTVVDVLCTILEDEGYRVLVAENGRAGMEVLAKERPDMVLCDMMMPVVDGAQMCRTMKADPRYADIPFVLMSAAQRPSQNSGCAYTAYMPKPFDYLSLLELVERIVGPATGDYP
jgi:CheY-like chemotaxis protein